VHASSSVLFAIGFILSLATTLAAWRVRALTWGGAVAATIVGTLVVGFGGWASAALLFLFFVTSSMLTHWRAADKPQPEHRRGRSAAQVTASGAVATALALWGGLDASRVIATAYAAAIAASAADTWATEIGVLSSAPPRLITSGQRVSPGRSGGVTWIGTVGGGLGAALIAVAAAWWGGTPFVAVWAAGSAAMLLDSVAGATIEGHVRGIGNNAVNVLMTAAAAFGAMLLAR